MSWIIRFSLSNLKKKPLRSALTILGIVIGTVSIVSMLSVGIGTAEVMMDNIEKTGDVKEITVYNTGDTSRRDRMLTDSLAESLGEIQGVAAVYPVVTLDASFSLNQFETYAEIDGVDIEYLKTKKLYDGDYPAQGGSRPYLMVGMGVKEMLYNWTTDKQYSETTRGKGSLTDETFNISFQGYDYTYSGNVIDYIYDEQTGQSEAVYDYSAEPKLDTSTYSVRLNISGMTDNEYDYHIYTDITTLKRFLKKYEVGGMMPGQPTDNSGNPYSEIIYGKIIVIAESLDYVGDISDTIEDMGFTAENSKEMVDAMQSMAKTMQGILGMIGAIALVVAVIGIINTMTTSVYDRMAEIGTLKMIGSDSEDILLMFLIESGYMGLVGGVVGVLMSWCVNKIVINEYVVTLLGYDKGTELAQMPWQLGVAACVGAVVIAMLAGVIPAYSAAKLKPVEAVMRGQL